HYADVSVAWGNIVLADHGLTVDDTPEDKTRNPYTTPASLAPDFVPRPNPALVLRDQTGTDDCASTRSGSHCVEHRTSLGPPRYGPDLRLAPLTQTAPYDPSSPPASAYDAGTRAVGEPRPAIRLTSFGPSQAATFNGLTITTTWTPVVDLLNSAGNE